MGCAQKMNRGLLSLLLALACAACSVLPTNGPNHRIIDAYATSARTAERGKIALDYVLVDVDKHAVDINSQRLASPFQATFGIRGGPRPRLRLGVGDQLRITIYESASSGLFNSGANNSTDGPTSVTLPLQTVDSSGFITVPFSGDIRAAGKTVRQLQRDIQAKLSTRAVEPQVIVSLNNQVSSEVAIFGDAAKRSVKRVVKPAGERILDLIASAGLAAPSHETFVTLRRGNDLATTYFPNLIGSTQDNVFVRPGDIIFLHRQQQTYVALGAIGATGQSESRAASFSFDGISLSLAEAVGKAGGLLDTQANASGVFIFRYESRNILTRLNVDLKKFDPTVSVIPTVYRANFHDPSMLFAANQFPIRHKDIVYVSNADSVELTKFLGFIETVTSSAAGIRDDWFQLSRGPGFNTNN